MNVQRRTFKVQSLLLCAAVALLAGCANITTTRITKTSRGLAINSGKDVTIGMLSYTGTNGESLVVSNYSANASVEAIKAQGQREAAALQETRAMLKDAYQAGKAAAATTATGGATAILP